MNVVADGATLAFPGLEVNGNRGCGDGVDEAAEAIRWSIFG